LSVKDLQCLGNNSGNTSTGPNLAATQTNAGSRITVPNNVLQVRVAQSGKLGIYNIKGGKVRALELRVDGHTIKTNGLPKGTYIATVSSGAWKRSVRMLIK
jgi:hypothetical protein